VLILRYLLQSEWIKILTEERRALYHEENPYKFLEEVNALFKTRMLGSIHASVYLNLPLLSDDDMLRRIADTKFKKAYLPQTFEYWLKTFTKKKQLQRKN
jgi:hypothetical protein